jgi:hypothetical protein
MKDLLNIKILYSILFSSVPAHCNLLDFTATAMIINSIQIYVSYKVSEEFCLVVYNAM